ncbi:MAG TPA: ABC transporter permease subunit [Leptospiraceae bacterium]|nr:ABC transporter permease [Leptospirales bacterium]HMU82576.1 ABC transporter permease subunit [Leptospiraceae bacterium]HMW58514.1 ABC transporter permease subunit [Leptospiraceae bacterium]HMX55127.1 ABC transporter permease subunit [Leptospiraceae bacterium]HMY43944.1 ABC transporter permease subunit [Leptospiraceae bacterium]
MNQSNRLTFGLSRIKWIFIKEMKSFFGLNYPPVSLGIIALLCGIVSALLPSTPGTTYEDVSRALFYLYYVFILVDGLLLSIGAFVQERRQGTLELLYTLPVTDLELVLAKFLPGALFISVFSILVTAIYVVGIAEAPYYIALSGALGLILAGLFATSVALFASSLTGSYLISLLVSAGILLLIEIGGYYGGVLPSPAKEIATHFHGLSQFAPFARGVISLKACVFFISLTIFFLFLTVRVLESRRWRLQAGGNG